MTILPPFVPGVRLAEMLYEEGVAPIMERIASGVPYAAALIGHGSDVLGYDTPRSMDHDWGPRLVVLIQDTSAAAWVPHIETQLEALLPATAMDFPTRYVRFPDDPATRMANADDGEHLEHRVRLTTLSDVLEAHLGIRAVSEIDSAFWVTVSEQQLLEITAGAVFRDDIGELTSVRERLAWYPDDIWRYRMAAGWMRISQMEPFVDRTGELDDDRGSRLIATRLVEDVMRLSMLQERIYAPYAKWLGTAFARSRGAVELGPMLDSALRATDWSARERALVESYVVLGRRHNALGLSPALDTEPRPFHSRPFSVIDAERFATGLMNGVNDPVVRALPRHIGGIDQYMDSTDALVSNELRSALRQWVRNR